MQIHSAHRTCQIVAPDILTVKEIPPTATDLDIADFAGWDSGRYFSYSVTRYDTTAIVRLSKD